MTRTKTRERRCSYVVLLDRAATSDDELRELAHYLSNVSLSDCEVVILDPSPRSELELHRRTLRWVGRHVAVRPAHRTQNGAVDVVRAAADLVSTEKVIVAAEDVRYTPVALEQICQLLDVHEVVEPQDYLDPLPWWGNIEAGRILVHRGIEPSPDHGATFGFRRGAIRSLRGLSILECGDDQVRRLAAHGAEVHPACDVFVRREPPAFSDWLDRRPRQAAGDFELPVKSAFFFALGPMLMLLAALGGLRLAGGYASVIAFAAIGLAFRGRSGAGAYFPLRACLFAPLWVAERSVSVYWALLRKLRGSDADPAGVPIPERAGGTKVASGE